MTEAEMLDKLIADMLAEQEKGATGAQEVPAPASDMPEDMILNPHTGQMTNRELLRNAYKGAVGTGGSAALGAGQGASFGFSDELNGAINAAIPGGGTMADRYAFGREATRAMQEVAQEEHPYAYTGGEVTGGLSTALATGYGAVGAGSSLPAQSAIGAGIGAAEGFGYGFGIGEGGAKERLESAGSLTLPGAAFGALAPPVTSLARGGYRMAKDVGGGLIGAATGGGSKDRAGRALVSTLNRSGLSVDDVQGRLAAALRDGQPAYTLADALGDPGARRVNGIARSGGDGYREIRDFLTSRQLDQPDRVGDIVGDAFGFRGNGSGGGQSVAVPGAPRSMSDVLSGPQATAEQTRDALKKVRSETSNVLYPAAAADAAPIDLSGLVARLDDELGNIPASEVKPGTIDAAMMNIRARMATQIDGQPAILSDYRRVLRLKQDLQTEMRTKNLYGTPLGHEYGKVINELDAALEAGSDGYRLANDTHRANSRIVDAVGEGAAMTRPGLRFSDALRGADGMTNLERGAARIGYGDKALARVEASTGLGANRALPFTSTKAKQEAGALAIDPALFRRRIGRENDMHSTFTTALTGSRTADNIQDMMDLQPYDMNLLLNLLQGNVRAAGQQAAQSGANAFTGMNSGTREMLARALLSRDASALEAAVNAAGTSDARKQIVDALLRIGGQRVHGERQSAQ